MRMKVYLAVILLFLLIACGNPEESNLANDFLSPKIEASISNTDLEVSEDGSYGEGSTIVLKVNFDENITVLNIPEIDFTLNNLTEKFSYVSGDGTKSLTFEYLVKSGDNDLNGIDLLNFNFDNGSLSNEDDIQVNETLINNTLSFSGLIIDTSINPPDKVLNLVTAPSTNGTELNLSWSIPNSDSGISSYRIQYRLKGELNWNNINTNSSNNTYAIDNLSTNQDYEIRVAAESSVIGEYSEISEVIIFNLLDLNPIAWLDANDPFNDGTLPLDGEKISRWVDKTGVATDAIESDSSRQPNIEYDVVNGLPAIRFDGQAQGLEGSFTRLDDNGLTIFLVAKMDTNNTRRAFFEFYSLTNSSRGFFFTHGMNEASTNFGLNDTSFNLWTAFDDGNFTDLYENGNLIYQNNPNWGGKSTSFTGDGAYILGDDRTGNDEFYGYICEFLVFDNQLSLEETNLIENYLKSKWNL